MSSGSPTLLDPSIRKGTILAYRVFDIAEEVHLPEVERILKQGPGGSRLSITRGGRNALVMRNPPVQLALGDVSFKLKEEIVRADVAAKIYDYGALSIVFQIPVASGTRWSELIPRGAMLNGDVPGAEELDWIAKKKCEELATLFNASLKTPSKWGVFEDYTIYFLEALDGLEKPFDLIGRGKVPELILGEAQEKLADKSREGILEYAFQYAENDLTVLDWNSAIVVEPTGTRDIPDVIEFALTHLLEFRYYDEVLDDRLATLYDAIEEKRGETLKSNFGELSREANTRFLEFSEFLERIDNSFKVVGDFYVAVIYRAAIRRFRILDWQQSITRKMGALSRVSQLLQSEVNVYRGHLLELVIILLILFEIIQAIVKSS